MAAADPADYTVVADRVSRAEADELGVDGADVIRAALGVCGQMIDAKRAVQAEQIIAAQAAEEAEQHATISNPPPSLSENSTNSGGSGRSAVDPWLDACRQAVYPIAGRYAPDGGWSEFEYAVNLYGVMAGELPAGSWQRQVTDIWQHGRAIVDGTSEDHYLAWWRVALDLHEQLIHHCGALGA